ncbi:MAG: hypothetical protein AABY22_16770 [Nanoarchaeota archaeon]
MKKGFMAFLTTLIILAVVDIAQLLYFKIPLTQPNLIMAVLISLVVTFILDKMVSIGENYANQ